MNTALYHLLMELPCLGVHCCDTGSAVAKRLLERLKDRINQRLCMTGRRPQDHTLDNWCKKKKKSPHSVAPLFSAGV